MPAKRAAKAKVIQIGESVVICSHDGAESLNFTTHKESNNSLENVRKTCFLTISQSTVKSY